MLAAVKLATKKLAGGKVTTPKGGRPTVPSQRKATQAEVVRLRGTGLTFQAIADRLGISDRQAQILWDEYWKKEHAAGQESAENIRAGLAARYRLLRDTAMALATNPGIKVTKDDPNGGTIDLADFEKVAKMGKLAVTCMVEEAKLFGVNKPVEADTNSATLSLAEFLDAAAKTTSPSGTFRESAA